MTPDWANHWTVAEAHDILLAKTSYQAELPIDHVPASTTLAEIWESLSDDCRLMLAVKHEDF